MLQKPQPSIIKIFYATFRGEIATAFIIATLFMAMAMVGPLIVLRRLIEYLQQDSDTTLKFGIALAFALAGAEIARY